MKVTRVAHAGIIVSSHNTQCVMDPVFFNAFECGAYRLAPAIAVDSVRLKEKRFDAVIVSHAHLDHFSIKSLNLINRDALFIYPEGDTSLEFCARWMGFEKMQPMKAFEKIVVGDLELTATRSDVDFPEMGMIFSSESQTCWNMVDSVIGLDTVTEVRRLVPRIDLLLAKYQPMIEYELRHDSLGSDFPEKRYSDALRNAVAADPRIVVPTACGFKASLYEWINDRQFPVSEKQFLRDLKRLRPSAAAFSLSPGEEIDLAQPTPDVAEGSLDWLRLIEEPFNYEWRPDKGVPPLDDKVTLSQKERESVRKFIEDEFIDLVRNPVHSEWVSVLQKHGFIWRLDVVGDVKFSGFIDFGQSNLVWVTYPVDSASLPFAHLQTSVTASAVSGLLTGEFSPSAVLGGGMIRVVRRLYEPSEDGASMIHLKKEEPLMAVLIESVKLRHLLRELASLEVTSESAVSLRADFVEFR